MLQRLFPKERDFFPGFARISDCMFLALSDLLSSVELSADKEAAVASIRSHEGKMNDLARETTSHLHDTFITPFDRVHIFKLVMGLKESVSIIRLLSEKIRSYELPSLPVESIELLVKCGEACALIRKMVPRLKKSKRQKETIELCLQVYDIAAAAKLSNFEVMRDLYLRQNDSRNVMKLKEINDDIVVLIEKFETLSHLIEEIILENG